MSGRHYRAAKIAWRRGRTGVEERGERARVPQEPGRPACLSREPYRIGPAETRARPPIAPGMLPVERTNPWARVPPLERKRERRDGQAGVGALQ